MPDLGFGASRHGFRCLRREDPPDLTEHSELCFFDVPTIVNTTNEITESNVINRPLVIFDVSQIWLDILPFCFRSHHPITAKQVDGSSPAAKILA